jgi:gpW
MPYVNAPFDPSQSILAGVPRAVLLANLATAQNAYMQLMTGTKIVQVGYTQGDGNKNVTYNQADMGALMAYIQLLQSQLGIVQRARQPMRPWFW